VALDELKTDRRSVFILYQNPFDLIPRSAVSMAASFRMSPDAGGCSDLWYSFRKSEEVSAALLDFSANTGLATKAVSRAPQ